ncbi:uncharacterized protein LOC133038525 [Cannabis sativa]|nr:uncharacterized protein LOC133038525 [Cannabis sativa]
MLYTYILYNPSSQIVSYSLILTISQFLFLFSLLNQINCFNLKSFGVSNQPIIVPCLRNLQGLEGIVRVNYSGVENKLRDLMENGEPRRSTRLNERAAVRDRARGRGRGCARGRGRGNQHVPAEAVIQENQNAPVNGQQPGQGGGNHEVPAGVVGQEHQNAPVVVPPQQEDLAQEVARLKEEIRKRDEEALNRQEQPNQGQHQFLPVQYMPVPEGRWEPIYERFRKQHPPNF